MASLVNHFSFPPTVFVFLLCQFVFINAFPACPVVSNFASLEDCIRSYWFIDYKYASIVTFLSLYHSIHITVRQLKYLINIKYNLRRRNNESAAHKVLQAVRYELNGPGCLMGYRSMTRCLRTREDLNVSCNTVMRLLKELDHVGVEQRRAR